MQVHYDPRCPRCQSTRHWIPNSKGRVTCPCCRAVLKVCKDEGFDGGLYRFVWLERLPWWRRLFGG